MRHAIFFRLFQTTVNNERIFFSENNSVWILVFISKVTSNLRLTPTEKSQLSNHEIAFKNYLQINKLIWVSAAVLSPLKECNFSILSECEQSVLSHMRDALTEKSPNVPKCESHLVDDNDGIVVIIFVVAVRMNA